MLVNVHLHACIYYQLPEVDVKWIYQMYHPLYKNYNAIGSQQINIKTKDRPNPRVDSSPSVEARPPDSFQMPHPYLNKGHWFRGSPRRRRRRRHRLRLLTHSYRASRSNLNWTPSEWAVVAWRCSYQHLQEWVAEMICVHGFRMVLAQEC